MCVHMFVCLSDHDCACQFILHRTYEDPPNNVMTGFKQDSEPICLFHRYLICQICYCVYFILFLWNTY